MKEEISWNGRDEYCEAIKDIMRDERMEVDQKLDELEQLYQWKPVRAEWFLAQARLLVEKEGQPEIGYATLKGMYFSKDDSDVAMDMLDFLAELDLMRGDASMAACRRFQIDLAKGNATEVVDTLSKVLEAESETLQQWEGFQALADSYLACCKYLNYEILRMYSAVFGENAIPDRECLMEEIMANELNSKDINKPFRYELASVGNMSVNGINPDVSRLREITGYTPQVGFSEGIRKILVYYEEGNVNESL